MVGLCLLPLFLLVVWLAIITIVYGGQDYSNSLSGRFLLGPY